MHKNQDKTNYTSSLGNESGTSEDKIYSSSIPTVVKTEIYPENRKKKGTKLPPRIPYTASMMEEHPIQTDPFGSYTGVPTPPDITPVQDVDDL